MVVSGTPSATGTLTASLTTVASVAFTAPSDGFVLLVAESEFSATQAGTLIDVRIQEGASTRFVGEWDPGDVDTFFDQTQSTTTVLPVAAGTHSYDLRLDEFTPGTFADYAGARLTVVFTAQGRATPTGP